ncbi:fungal hydrophobin-domain-containing protein [Cyathus striatus]|nr:fungal hydrophobin-domain-containing protein [Cyathus striatus]
MQIKSAVFTTLALATFAAATGTPIPASQCTTGNLQCCNSTGTAKNSAISTLLGLLGIVISDITALVGVTCSPISVIGVGGNSCTAQPVCCTNNSFNGVVALGCTPVNLNL